MKKFASAAIFLSSCIFSCCYGQRYAANWYFGIKAGIAFNFQKNPPEPYALPLSPMSAAEGCASISDSKSGELLFYTNGNTVYNKEHQVMVNGTGLFGSMIAAQSAVIVPQPWKPGFYYIFTIHDWLDHEYKRGLYYSVVDMSQAGGLGAIVSKNVLVLDSCRERVVAAYHANCRDFWIISHMRGNDSFAVFRISPDGVDQPIFSKTGSVYPEGKNPVNCTGTLRLSPDGKLLASAFIRFQSGNFPVIELFKFNSATGKVSDGEILFMSSDELSVNYQPFNIEFSPGSKKMYVAGYSSSGIYQYDLSSGDPQKIRASRYMLKGTVVKDVFRSNLQLGPDGKIYIIGTYRWFLDVIHQPDRYRDSCQFQADFLKVAETATGRRGLPNFLPVLSRNSSPLKNKVSFKVNCKGEVQFYCDSMFNDDRYDFSWDFGDPSGGNNASKLQNPLHQYSKAGNYTARVIIKDKIWFCNDPDTSLLSFYVWEPVKLDLGPDRTLCYTGQLITLDPKISGGKLTWSTGDSGRSINVSQPGAYSVTYTSDCGTLKDEIKIYPRGIQNLDLGPDKILCQGEVFTINPVKSEGKLLWSDGSQGSDLHVASPGKYWARLSTDCDTIYDTIEITWKKPVSLDLGADQVWCESKQLILDSKLTEGNWDWSTGETSPSIQVTKGGLYILHYNNGCDTLSDTVSVTDFSSLLHGPQYIDHCREFRLILKVPKAFTDGLWSDGQSGKQIISSDTGWVTVQLNKDGCAGTDSFHISLKPGPLLYVPSAFTPNKDGHNEYFPFETVPMTRIKIYNRWGECVFESDGKGWDGRYKDEDAPQGVYFCTMNYSGCLNKVHHSTFTLIR